MVFCFWDDGLEARPTGDRCFWDEGLEVRLLWDEKEDWDWEDGLEARPTGERQEAAVRAVVARSRRTARDWVWRLELMVDWRAWLMVSMAVTVLW